LAAPAKATDFKGERNMNRAGLWAIGVAGLATVGLTGIEARAGENERGCTLATLHGQYLFAGPATLFPPAFGVTAPTLAASAGFHIFNGDGTGTDFVTFTVEGIDQHVPSPVPITYTLNADCTGTYSVQNGPNLIIFVAVDGSALSVIEATPGVSASYGPDPRVGSSRRAD
jgi:hypothetical protein